MVNALELVFPKHGAQKRIIVEAGHIYTNEQPSLEHRIGAQRGGALSDFLTHLGVSVEKWLFIDNYNPRFESAPETLDVDAYVAFMEDSGFAPDVTVYEADLVGHAQRALQELQQGGLAGPKGDSVVLHKGNVRLFEPESEKYSCALLDACLYMQKLERADACITILDKQYAAQQKGTSTILKKLGIDTAAIFPFYYDIAASQPNANLDAVAANDGERLGFIQPAISLLQTIGTLSGTVSAPKVGYGVPG